MPNNGGRPEPAFASAAKDSQKAAAASFRDPAGYVFFEDGAARRAVTVHGREDYDLMMSSGLYTELAERSFLTRHTEEAPDPASGLYKILAPEQIRHISYYYEWSFSQLQDAALLTLEVQKTALRHGMSLKDASAFNIQFRGPRPVFIDTLSFERNRPGPWSAYGQFCSHFLAPLALMSKVSLDFGRYLQCSLEGMPLALASQLLPLSTRLNPGLLLHIHLHARSVKKYSAAGALPEARRAPAGKDYKAGVIDSLAGCVKGLSLPKVKTEWIDYYNTASHYSDAASAFKKEWLTRVLDRTKPSLVYDLGGNVGAYTRLATSRGIDAVCYDIDPLCVNENYVRAKADGDAHMLPLLADLTNPSPPLGFALEERSGFIGRSKPDLAFALALIHHLRITGNVPLRNIARFLARVTPRLVIEYVPKEDPMAQVLIRNRPDIFHDYTAEHFYAAFGEHYRLEDSAPIPNTSRELCIFSTRL